MKQALEPLDIMEMMVDKLQLQYPDHDYKKEGIIQFHLKYKTESIDCYIKANHEKLEFHEGISEQSDVIVKSSFYNWLGLAAGTLNPVWGVITRKLIFKGDTSLFKVLPKKDFTDKLDIPKDPVTQFERNPVKYWKVPKKVVILNSSPRGKNGYTDFYLKPFIKGMQKHTEVELVYLSDYTVKPCDGCFACWMNKPGECKYQTTDDFNKLADKLYPGNLLVYAFPIYADGMPGILKNYFDRSVSRAYPYIIPGLKGVRHPRRYITENQSMVIFSICGFFEEKNFEPVKVFFHALANNRHCPVVGEIYRTTAVGLYGNPFLFKMQNQVLQALEKAGEEIVTKGKIKKKTKKIISQKIKATQKDMNKINEWWNEKKGSKDYNY